MNSRRTRLLKHLRNANIAQKVFRWSHVFVDVIVINMLMPDLTSDQINQHLVKAVATVNCLEVLSPVLTILLMFMSDTYVNRHKETLCLAAAYIVGLVMLSLVASLHDSIKASLHEFTKDISLYIALTLVTVGKAGVEVARLGGKTSYHHLHTKQQQDQEKKKKWPLQLAFSWNRIWPFQLAVVTLPWIYNFKGLISYALLTPLFLKLLRMSMMWRCITSAITISAAAMIWFVLGNIKHVLRKDDDEILQELDLARAAIPRLQFVYYKFLNIVTGVEDSSSSSDCCDRHKKPEAETTKLILMMIPFWLTFIAYGLIESSGSTFFIDQASNLYPDSGFRLFYVQPIVKPVVSDLFDCIFPGNLFAAVLCRDRRWRPVIVLVKMLVGMICSVLCCIAAWLDEDRRRHRKNGGQSPIWLVPQLTLWALMAGLAARGLDEFFNQRALEFSDQTATISRAGCQLNKCVKGIGRILNLLCIFYFCSDWFREDLETSRLDLYYKRLAIVGFLNLVVFCFVVAVYGRYLFDQANAHQANNNVVERGMPASQESAAIMNLETTMDQGTIKPSSSSSQAESQHLIHYSSS